MPDEALAIGIGAAFNQARADFKAREEAYTKALSQDAKLRQELTERIYDRITKEETREDEQTFRADQAQQQREFLTALQGVKGSQAMEQIGARGTEARETKKVPPAKRLGGGGAKAVKDLTPGEQRTVAGAANMLRSGASEADVVGYIRGNQTNYGFKSDETYLLNQAKGILKKAPAGKAGAGRPDLSKPFGAAGQAVVKFSETPNYFAP